MRVGIVTTWGERCGLATYSKNITEALPDIDWRVIAREDWGNNFDGLPPIADECDLVHIMHHGGLMASMSPEIIKACGKTVVTRQCTGSEEVFSAATIKTCHEPRQGYRWVPHGIPTLDNYPLFEPRSIPQIGVCGIPFDGKGHKELIDIATVAKVGVRMVIPDSPHTGSEIAGFYNALCSERGIPCDIMTGWPSENKVSWFLATNDVNVFFYTRPANGTSGAVRLGLAAGRPVIVSNHSQFSDLIEYGCVTVADSIGMVANLVRSHSEGITSLVWPGPVLDEWSYESTAEMYRGIYNEIYE